MIFAGVTVAISITGLALIGLDFITKLGIGSALGVLTAVLLATSLLPAVLSLLGNKIDRGRFGLPRRRRVARGAGAHARSPPGAASSRGHAKIVLPVVLVVLLLLASPVLAVRLGLADAGTAPKDQTTRKAYDLLTSGFGPGFTEPIPVVVDMQSDHARRRQARDGAADGARASRRSTSRSTTRRTTTWRRSRSSTPTGSTSRRTRRPTTSSRRSGTR